MFKFYMYITMEIMSFILLTIFFLIVIALVYLYLKDKYTIWKYRAEKILNDKNYRIIKIKYNNPARYEMANSSDKLGKRTCLLNTNNKKIRHIFNSYTFQELGYAREDTKILEDRKLEHYSFGNRIRIFNFTHYLKYIISIKDKT